MPVLGPNAPRNYLELGNIARQQDVSKQDYMLGEAQNIRNYQQGQRSLVSRFSDRGTARSGLLASAMDQMKTNRQLQAEQGQLAWQRQVSELDHARRVATMGLYTQ